MSCKVDASRWCQDMTAWIRNVLAGDVRWTVNLPQRRQLAVYIPDVWNGKGSAADCWQFDGRYHEAAGIGRTECSSTRQVVDTGQRTEVTWCIAMFFRDKNYYITILISQYSAINHSATVAPSAFSVCAILRCRCYDATAAVTSQR